MSKIEKFENWAKQFIAIQDSHVKEFLGSIGDLSLHEMKILFSEKYQNKIELSYVLQAESNIIRDVHIEMQFDSSFCTVVLEVSNVKINYSQIT